MIDTHCHLNSEQLYKRIDEVILKADSVAINRFIVPGYDFETSKIALEIAHKYPNCYAAIGFHPTEIKGYSDEYKWLEENANDDKVVAIGECGYDFHWDVTTKEEQEELETLINKNFMRSTKCKSIKSINKDTLYDVIYEKTKIPIKKILKYNKNSLTLSLNKTVFGQKKAIDEILDITFSRKINKNVPTSLLLVGKTGVGKTLFVKEYARLLYPKTAFIRLDMSEYKEGHSISKIIGAPAGYVGYNDNNCILEKVKDNPYSIFLIDEIEKAHPDVLRLFLQVLDTGCMTNSYGELIDFSNVVIFMTSNLGTTNKKIGFSSDNSLVYEKFKEFLGVEFINRIDKVIYFDDIDSNTIGKIISKRALDLGFEKDFSPELVNKIKNECNYKEFGARHVDKVLRKYVDTFTIKH